MHIFLNFILHVAFEAQTCSFFFLNDFEFLGCFGLMQMLVDCFILVRVEVLVNFLLGAAKLS